MNIFRFTKEIHLHRHFMMLIKRRPEYLERVREFGSNSFSQIKIVVPSDKKEIAFAQYIYHHKLGYRICLINQDNKFQ